jgi:hypothetical protein
MGRPQGQRAMSRAITEVHDVSAAEERVLRAHGYICVQCGAGSYEILCDACEHPEGHLGGQDGNSLATERAVAGRRGGKAQAVAC